MSDSTKNLMEHYFGSFIKWTGMSKSQFWDWDRRKAVKTSLSLWNILAFKMTHRRNAVSLVHGQLSRHIWRDVWKGFNDADIPIRHINQRHAHHVLPGAEDEGAPGRLFGNELGDHLTDPERWKRIQDIPDTPCGGHVTKSGRRPLIY